MMPVFDPTMQQIGHQQVFVVQQGHGGQQMILQPAPQSGIVSSSHQQQQQYQFEQHEAVQQQPVQPIQQQLPPTASNDHSYAAYSDAMGLYDDGSEDAHNFSPVEKRAPVLRDAPQSKPMGRIVPKKRSSIERRVGETDSATAAAGRRISTEEGWKSMNGWLKAAELDVNKLLQLLGQCREAKVTVSLLRSNDTPKFIRKLSKNHKDEEVRALSLSIVTKWKKVVNTPDVVEEKKEKEKKEEKKEEFKEEEEESHEMKSRSLPVEKRRLSDEGVSGEKKTDPKKEKDHRAKPKVYQSKGRSTGLEGDDGANPAKKRSINETSPSTGAPPAKKSSTEKAPAPASATTPPPKKPAPVKKITTSSSFMDSLLSPAAAAQPKKKVLPKRPISKPEVKIARPNGAGGDERPDAPRGVIDMLLSPNAEGKVAMEGLFADTSRSLKDDRAPSPPKVTNAPVIFVAEEPNIVVGKRKIRFADEHGGELVETRFFEIEEGERINVNRYTPEEMKHYEAVQENKWMKDNSGIRDDDEDDETEEVAKNPWMMPGQNVAPVDTPSHKWRFIPTEPDDRPEVIYGGQSQMKTIQEQRQSTAMRAFYSPHERCSHFDEPENVSGVEPEASEAGLRLEPIIIPTEPVPFEEEEEIDGVAMDELPSAAVPATVDSPAEPDSTAPAVIPDRLKALINGLKTKGLLHDGSEDPSLCPPIVDPYSVPPPGVTPVIIPATIPTTSTYFQEQPRMMPVDGFHPNRMHSIQQEFPGQAPPHPVVIPGAAASSSGIQVVNMDVHGPAPTPQGGRGGGGGDTPFPHYMQPGRNFYVSNKPCTFFNSPRGCKFGDKCGFAHVLMDPSMNGGPPGGFRGGMRGMRGDFRGGPPRGTFRGRGGGFGGPPPPFGNRDGPPSRDVDMRRGGSWRDERRDDRRERRRSRSRSPSPSRRDRDHRSSRREDTAKDIDLRTKDESRPAPAIDDDDIDGVPIQSPVV
ncbi:hypothetical protein PENTCL1PPCAC_27426 [Pristionchus entomophagus]|uniref:Serine/threonine-protein phosphatase 1 regulatory subunit 10 n=1 Tax=Pristionchus entomophagus TaxID=358040 RepID=A0AAV5UF90_9BILA|nr:hypothetical protein PENTCL1PPCAC_27426 [Pristionchus entomophagus]